MREIKFRAWSKKYNEMWGVANLSWVIDKKYDEPERDIASIIQTVGAINEGKTVSKVGNNSAKDLILMQYTGLKDKNGKEIYEGDILSIPQHYDGDSKVHAYNDSVTFYEGGFGLDKNFGYELSMLTLNNMTEVIGNIYENPELLK